MKKYTGQVLFDIYLLEDTCFTELIYGWLGVISTNLEGEKRRKAEMILDKKVSEEKLESSSQILLRWTIRIKDNEALVREIWEDPSLRPAHLPKGYFLREIEGLEKNIECLTGLVNNLSSDIHRNRSRIQELSEQIDHLEETEQRTKQELDRIIYQPFN